VLLPLSDCPDSGAVRAAWERTPSVPGHPRVRVFELSGREYVGLTHRLGGEDLFALERETTLRLAEGPRVALGPLWDFIDLMVLPKAAPLAVPGFASDDVADDEYAAHVATLMVGVHRQPPPTHRMRVEQVLRLPIPINRWANTPERVVQLVVRLGPHRGRVDEITRLRLKLAKVQPQVTVHGDLKPDNIMIGPAATAVGIDWEMSGAGPAAEDFAALWAGLFVEMLAQSVAQGAGEDDLLEVAVRTEHRLERMLQVIMSRYVRRMSVHFAPADLYALGLLRLMARLESVCRTRSAPSVDELFLLRAVTHGLESWKSGMSGGAT
jgi:hypothetical protein